MRARIGCLAGCLAVFVALGCANPGPNVKLLDGANGKDYYRALPPGAHALRKITDPAMIPDFTAALRDVSNLREAVSNSIHYMAKPSSKTFFPMSGISHEQVKISLDAFRALLDSGKIPEAINAELRSSFDVYISVGCDDSGTVLFTGYYTPIFDASPTQGGEYQYPLHGLPPNHVKDPITGETLGRKRADGSIDKNYPSRKELLASGELKGLEIAWLKNPFEAYVAMVQGSAFLRLPSGEKMEIGYAGNNGKGYTSIGMELVKSGKMKREELNLRKMIEYFAAHPSEFEPLAAKNERYVFFQRSSGGPFGTLNERVLPMRSIATDKSIFPRGSVCFLSTNLPPLSGSIATQPYAGFVLDQDAGGAIRAPGRCDVFMGVGDEAGERAGHVYAEGKLYYLILKDGAKVSVSR